MYRNFPKNPFEGTISYGENLLHYLVYLFITRQLMISSTDNV